MSAFGVGGLLFISEISNSQISNSYATAYDGNGNVMALVDCAKGAVVSRYEYGPFGEVLRATGRMATPSPFRFSTKYQDDETDLLYYGFRYYNPNAGRWISSDPIEELGGLNLTAFVQNGPIGAVDALGLVLPPGSGVPYPPIQWPPRPSHPKGGGTFSFCRRPLQDPKGILQRCANRICGIHSFTMYTDPSGKEHGWGFDDSGVPHEETYAMVHRKGLVCAQCELAPTALKYGSGAHAGKTGQTATGDEIWDCLQSRPALDKFNPLTYNCWIYSLAAQGDCGLNCKLP